MSDEPAAPAIKSLVDMSDDAKSIGGRLFGHLACLSIQDLGRLTARARHALAELVEFRYVEFRPMRYDDAEHDVRYIRASPVDELVQWHADHPDAQFPLYAEVVDV